MTFPTYTREQGLAAVSRYIQKQALPRSPNPPSIGVVTSVPPVVNATGNLAVVPPPVPRVSVATKYIYHFWTYTHSIFRSVGISAPAKPPLNVPTRHIVLTNVPKPVPATTKPTPPRPPPITYFSYLEKI